jgi:hypothetical protein
MNREQAIRAVADKSGPWGPFTSNLVDAMEAMADTPEASSSLETQETETQGP